MDPWRFGCDSTDVTVTLAHDIAPRKLARRLNVHFTSVDNESQESQLAKKQWTACRDMKEPGPRTRPTCNQSVAGNRRREGERDEPGNLVPTDVRWRFDCMVHRTGPLAG